MKHNKLHRRWPEFIGGILTIYILTYVVLSCMGGYQPIFTDLRRAEYGWVPLGFYPKGHQKPNWATRTLFFIYIPLWEVDSRFIHDNPPTPSMDK